MGRVRGLFVLVLSALAAVLEPARAAIEVANGTASNEWPAVGALIVQVGGGYAECTATLISPTWVLTATHCLTESANPQDYKFIMSPDYACCLPTGGLPVASIWINPAYNGSSHDTGLVQLASPVPGVTPFLVNDGSPPNAGSYLHVLGYGLTELGSNSLKRAGLVQVTNVYSTTFAFGGVQPYAQLCQGDSGGPSYSYAPNGFPLLDAVFSYFLSDGIHLCSTSNTGVEARTDSDVAFITAHATDACLLNALVSAPGSCGDGIFRGGLDSRTIAPAAPEVTLQPIDTSVPQGKLASFKAAASGDPAPTVQWQSSPDGISFTDLAGATSTALQFAPDTSQSGLHLRAVFTNALGANASDAAVLTVRPDYQPAHCTAVASTLDIYWDEVDGALPACVGIEHTDGSLADAADGSFSMNGVSATVACLAASKYIFQLSPDQHTLLGGDTKHDVPMTLTLSDDGACFVGHYVSGADDFVATIWNFVPH